MSSKSRPTRARGLKSVDACLLARALASRPTRARGLKFFYLGICIVYLLVAPYAGAWIEITIPAPQASIQARRALRGRVD